LALVRTGLLLQLGWLLNEECKSCNEKLVGARDWIEVKGNFVATLALGSRPRQRGCKGAGQEEGGSHITYSQECKKVWGSEPSHSQVNSHVESWSPERTPKSSERNCRGENSLPWKVFYIIGKVLKFRCPKWPRLSHLDVCSPSYGQKKGRESNYQFERKRLLTTKSRESTRFTWL
jgi:hypothetical protein